MSKKISLINLGCVRNLVDAQGMLGRLQEKGFDLVALDKADTVIVNTCGFIKDAKQESVDAILDVIEWKKSGQGRKIIVAGCLSQRYASELKQEFPEVDAFVGVPALLKDKVMRQVPLSPEHLAYLKICESCFNHCAFCIIPKIKGKFSSRTIASVLEEVRQIDERGVKELNIIGQDITAYGMDLYHEKSLARLLKEIAREVKNIRWIRLLYAFPAHITDDLLDVIAQEPRVCKYVDVPLQHVSDKILKDMHRGMTLQQTRDLVERIRRKIPGVKIRSAFIVGLPGEGEREFAELMDFVRWAKLDRVGVFAYSPEEGTPAFVMPQQVDSRVKQQRLDQLMKVQQNISRELNQGMIGKGLEVLVEGYDEERQMFFARSEYDAPDVDGMIHIRSENDLSIGEFVRVKVVDADEYDLVGEIL